MKTVYIFLVAIFCFSALTLAGENYYEVVKDQATVRVDSTASAKALGIINKGDQVQILGEKFDWYRIILPARFPCFVFGDLTEAASEGRVKITATNVNLRSGPSLESPVIGKPEKGAIFVLISSSGDWLKIENNSQARGWVHKLFLKQKVDSKDLASLEAKLATSDSRATYEIIVDLTKLGKANPELIGHFFKAAQTSAVRQASVYLDVLQNIIKPEGEQKAYFYQAENSSLTVQEVKEAIALLEQAFNQGL